MGCAIGKSHKVSDSSSTLGQNGQQPVEVIRTPDNLLNFFSKDVSVKAKCIFIFGGSGSQKGEFIWELMRQHVQGPDNYSFCYIDVQYLIASHIKARVLELTGGDFTFGEETAASIEQLKEQRIDVELLQDEVTKCPVPEVIEEPVAEIRDDISEKSDGENNTIHVEEVRPYLIEFSNIVSCSWVVGLIEKEIACRQEASPTKLIFLVNLLPNRMNLFKNCLYLRQTPNLRQCAFEYFAVNLVKGDCTKKDLDLVDQLSSFDEINMNFLNYFRNINKLVDLKIQPSQVTQLTIKLNRSKQAKKVSNPQELMEVLRSEKRQVYELDIRDYSTTSKLKRGAALLFFINNEIDINEGEVVILVDPSEKNLDAIKHFAQSVLKVKKALEPPIDSKPLSASG